MAGHRMAAVYGGSIAFVAATMAMMPFGPRIVFDAPDRSGGGGKSAAELAAEVRKDFETKHDKVKEIAEKALAEAEKGVPLAGTAKELADQALLGMNEAKARLDELEQKMARRGNPSDSAQTAGQRFVEDDGFKTFAGQTRPRGRHIVEVKDISSLTTDAAGSVGTLVQPDRVAPVDLPRRRMTIRALIAPGNTTSNSVEYDKEKGFTNNAAPVAEGAQKPQSEIQYEEATAPVRTIAHWMRASVQILADAPGLRSMIDNRLRYGLAYIEEVQILNGSGVGQNLSGLVTEATTFAAPGALVADQKIDTVRLGMLQVALAEYPPNGVVLNPIDWAFIEMMKDEHGRYLIGNPQGTLNPTLWGLPVIATQAMAQDKFLAGAFDLAAQIFDRQDATVEVSTEDQDNFVKNKVTIRAEERLALAIYRPEALVYGDLTPPAPPTP
ncbi:phage major capsid protein [Georhizobium profundi]|uniref:Phage major capsid protein n=1 Tax=Georhizobium profundi TaxID=2341112 RepID=A0A3Q8XQ64_9HYPH|nr:phage major capsid protein [Georhizobium profundi]AZN72748.1 phage major capsid protein [Georhizobium profundi]